MESLIVYDQLWAPNGYWITDPILIKLINSNTVNRMKWIGQYGSLNHRPMPNGIIGSTTRYMHSIGAMILTLIVGGTIEEAIAALLHDIIHTSFSHTFDYIAKSSSVSYHEKHKDRLLEQFENELILILGIEWKKFLNEENWPLIKKNNPFAIDIADYIARDAVAFNFCDINEVQSMVTHLRINNNRCLITTSVEASNWWNQMSQTMHDKIYGTPWNCIMNHYLALALKELIDNGNLTIDELEKCDNCDFEKNAFAMAINTFSGKLFEKIGTINWEFFSIDCSLETKWIIIGTFDIRHRIVNPPINEIYFDELPTKIEKYILAYTT